ncbi:HAD family hydrolase [Ferrimonas sediminicola]|uniref:phosphoglycolate phosphatase n=1 Tax=Ferrimonas sediminicola TaxID=2569538 RepID=A0A4V5NWH9_9GAMM|nr:HAD hydrolase-like protein [Ferrimonas sediminicola]TKB46873.1 HAD family hydrolase [Ferrimonas sediminicola]
MPQAAILWDYDGTLVNSAPRNISITLSILDEVAPRLSGDNLPHCLRSEARYHQANHAAENWQDLYLNYYGLTPGEAALAGPLWAKHQRRNTMEVGLFEGIADAVAQLQALPHGICSQNDSTTIWRQLRQADIAEPFRAVVGYNEVAGEAQKPHPAGGLKCIEAIFGKRCPDTLFYIGDHQGDVQFARSLEQALAGRSRVIAIAAAYSGALPGNWVYQPDQVAHSPAELPALCRRYL